MANDGDIMLDHLLAQLGTFHIAAGLDCQINNHGAGRHAFDHLIGHEDRGRSTRNKRRCDDHILLFDVLGNDLFLFLKILVLVLLELLLS